MLLRSSATTADAHALLAISNSGSSAASGSVSGVDCVCTATAGLLHLLVLC
jgi:hypothetical protein